MQKGDVDTGQGQQGSKSDQLELSAPNFLPEHPHGVFSRPLDEPQLIKPPCTHLNLWCQSYQLQARRESIRHLKHAMDVAAIAAGVERVQAEARLNTAVDATEKSHPRATQLTFVFRPAAADLCCVHTATSYVW